MVWLFVLFGVHVLCFSMWFVSLLLFVFTLFVISFVLEVAFKVAKQSSEESKKKPPFPVSDF